MRVAICDDHIRFLDNFNTKLESCLEVGDKLYSYVSGADLLSDWYGGKQFEIIFLDIEMPGLDGFEVAKEIRQTSEEVLIVIVTNHSNRALESFSHEPLNFLVKPVTSSQIRNVIERARRKLPLPPVLAITTAKGIIRIPIRDVLYIEIFMGKLTVHTFQQAFSYNGRMQHVQKILEPHGFFLCHRSILINLDYVGRIKSSSREVIIRGIDEGIALPVSADRLQNLLRLCIEKDLA